MSIFCSYSQDIIFCLLIFHQHFLVSLNSFIIELSMAIKCYRNQSLILKRLWFFWYFRTMNCKANLSHLHMRAFFFFIIIPQKRFLEVKLFRRVWVNPLQFLTFFHNCWQNRTSWPRVCPAVCANGRVFTASPMLVITTGKPLVRYSGAQHHDISVRDGPPRRWWSPKINPITA